MPRQPQPPPRPTSLDEARREREDSLRRRAVDPLTGLETDIARVDVAASDVVALLNRVGECVRALPSFGRTRTQTSAVVAKRTLSAISTCSPSGLAEGDELRAVLARLDATRRALGAVVRPPGDPESLRAGEDAHRSREERIDELARAGALIAAEIDRLQHQPHRRYA